MTVSKERQDRFLESLAKTGRIMESCDAAGISHETLRNWRKIPEFAEDYSDSELRYCDKIEREIERRAIEGWDEPVFGSKGKDEGSGQIGEKRKFSDSLLLALTKSRNARYRDKVEAELTVKGRVLVVPQAALTEEDFNEQVGKDGS